MITSFADDTQASRPIHGPEDIYILQQDINTIYAWAQRVNMEFNGEKFEGLRCWYHTNKFRLNHHYKDPVGEDISESDRVKDLGVLFSPDLTFKIHIQKNGEGHQ